MTAESGVDEFGVRRRVCCTVATEDEAKRLEVKLQHEIYEGQHVKPSTESVASFCARYLEDHRDASLSPALGRWHNPASTVLLPEQEIRFQ